MIKMTWKKKILYKINSWRMVKSKMTNNANLLTVKELNYQKKFKSNQYSIHKGITMQITLKNIKYYT